MLYIQSGCKSKTVGHTTTPSETWDPGTLVTRIWGVSTGSVQCYLGVNQFTFLKVACNSKTARRREKRSEIWDFRTQAIHNMGYIWSCRCAVIQSIFPTLLILSADPTCLFNGALGFCYFGAQFEQWITVYRAVHFANGAMDAKGEHTCNLVKMWLRRDSNPCAKKECSSG